MFDFVCFVLFAVAFVIVRCILLFVSFIKQHTLKSVPSFAVLCCVVFCCVVWGHVVLCGVVFGCVVLRAVVFFMKDVWCRVVCLVSSRVV